jgi:hypothetical protein
MAIEKKKQEITKNDNGREENGSRREEARKNKK